MVYHGGIERHPLILPTGARHRRINAIKAALTGGGWCLSIGGCDIFSGCLTWSCCDRAPQPAVDRSRRNGHNPVCLRRCHEPATAQPVGRAIGTIGGFACHAAVSTSASTPETLIPRVQPETPSTSLPMVFGCSGSCSPCRGRQSSDRVIDVAPVWVVCHSTIRTRRGVPSPSARAEGWA